MGWIALSDLAKYLRRGSIGEAQARLTEARDLIFRLWAARREVEYPGYGLTALLDASGVPLPERIEETVAWLDADAILHGARRCALLLQETGVPLAMG